MNVDRLTKRIADHVYYTKGQYEETIPAECSTSDVRAILQHLAAFEDIGMEPEEITLMKDREEWQPMAKITQMCGVTFDRLRELAEASKDGRCVVLPCKVGDMVFVVDTINGITGVYIRPVTSIMCANWDGEFFVKLGLFGSYSTADFGKTVFLTRESAEAALKAGDTP